VRANRIAISGAIILDARGRNTSCEGGEESGAQHEGANREAEDSKNH